jgi:two-component system, chemotaxis family, CheB/CheR fusion protein
MPSQQDIRSKNGEAVTAQIDLPDGSDLASAHRFLVVGIGASAGGLDAFKALLAKLPPDTGMAFVLIQHLDPLHVSLMGSLLASHTAMPVSQAAEGVLIEPNRVYLIPPAVSLSVSHGKLHLSEPAERQGARTAFDFFLRSLAEECGGNAACVVLSGTGSDGSEGLKAVKAKGGFVVVQKPSEAAFDGMPKSAIQTGQTDLVLPIAEIPAALISHVKRIRPSHSQPHEYEGAQDRFLEILDLVRTRTRHDFSPYKTGTLTRRIERRMAIAGMTDAARYIDKLSTDACELDSLGRDLLINVTQFFRDADSFEALARSVIPEMIAAQQPEKPLRIWVPGCSTGEEAYSLAIVFLEAIAVSKRRVKLQVFASDVDAHSIAFARAGLYDGGTASQMSPGRLEQFFTQQSRRFRVVRDLREAVVFTVQDLLADPPFSRLDLISCRNVLIYLQPRAQEQILSLFHFALRAGGILFLGWSETVGKFTERFQPINKKQRIYRHRSAGGPGEAGFRSSGAVQERLAPAIGPPLKRMPAQVNLEDVTSKHLLEAFAPPSVLVDKKYETLFCSGAIDRYLQVSPGETNRNVLAMAREGIRPNLRAALDIARKTGELTSKPGARVHREGATHSVKIVAKPIPPEEMFLVSFLEEPGSPPPVLDTEPPTEDTSRVLQLEEELDVTRKDLSATIRDLEISNEDLRAVNDEALSINEEFQSTNEELETSKEELQALNEELTALNGQLQETLEHQRATAADLQNILNSSDVATIFLDTALNIRFFTPAAKLLFGISGVDIGRPLADLAQRFDDDALLPDVHAVLSKLAPIRREIESQDRNWYIRSVLPYQSAAEAIGGVVITFAQISEMKAAERKIEAAKAYAESIIATVKQPLVVLDEDSRIVSANASFCRAFDVKPEESVGKQLGVWSQLQAQPWAAFLAAARSGKAIENCEVEIELPKLGSRTLLVSAREIIGITERRKILVSIDDITDAKAEAGELAAAKLEAERANLAKSRFLGAASHDLRQPLQTMSLLQGMLADEISEPAASKLIKRLEKTIGVMSSLLDNVLNINQLEAGAIEPKLIDFNIGDLLRQLHSEFELQVSNSGLALRVVPCHLTVHSDPHLLEQILRNMLSNATKYTTQGKVLLGCRRHGDRLCIEVCDTGTGIPETELSAIFKEFHQLENRSGRQPKGLGLGLTIVQRIADLIEAPISVRSRLGCGSIFAVEVPLAGTPARPDPPVRSETEPSDRPVLERGHAVLIVEDDSEVLDTLKLLLDSRGYRSFTARNSAQALEVIADRGSDLELIIADYNLPGPNGIEVASKIEEAAGRKIPAILLTGDISAATLREIAGKEHVHLYKPADARVLMRHVTGILSQKAGPPTVFIVDDDQEIRETMRDSLERYGFRARVFADGASFLKSYSPDQSGCVLADARMPGIGGLKLIERLAGWQPSIPVIMITAYGDVGMAVTAMKAGAFDFLQKPVGQNELLDCIKRAFAHPDRHPVLTAERQAAAAKIESLTARQRQILDLVLAGSPSKNIAADLGISQRTVDNHRAAIMRKAGAKSLSALIRVALAAA